MQLCGTVALALRNEYRQSFLWQAQRGETACGFL